ncbi:F0F1 ATP synthase subunit A [Herbaspirillum sp. RV1423]|uniref:F0F1 ATP synthase subunit A n=1 Tax=Herbaspirillum sp. RV1423 TaxID=1443993 RepID=UPI0004AC7189|nr:F0F1 ATP synthase subunit A [Herbaspirillum sp. RV1423]
MIHSPLSSQPLFFVGPVPIGAQVLTTWAIIALAFLFARWLTRRLSPQPGRLQVLAELFLTVLQNQIRDTVRVDPAPYVPLIGSLFLFILCANLSSLAPGVEAPTAHIETDAALALIVFCAIVVFGIRSRGAIGYLKSFADPSWIMVPLNLVEAVTRTFSLMVRLFGNMMSGAFVIGIVLSLAGLFVPIPFMALDLLVGVIQAYIFSVLTLVFIGAAIGDEAPHPQAIPTDAIDTHKENA